MHSITGNYCNDRLKQIVTPEISQQLVDYMEKWSGCVNCGLSAIATRKVFFRGYVPCDILFVGEAPGPSEDALGRPFVGSLADTFDFMLSTVIDLVEKDTGYYIKWCVTNAVACLPYTGKDIKKPAVSEIKACSSRLKEFILMSDPWLVVKMGDVAERAVNLLGQLPAVIKSIRHPGWMVRQRDPELEVKKAVLFLTNTIKGRLNAGPRDKQLQGIDNN